MVYGSQVDSEAKKNVPAILLGRDEFGGSESSTRNMDADGAANQLARCADTCASQMDRMWEGVSMNEGRIVADVQVDPDLTRSIVAARMKYAEENYTDWTETLRRVSIGVVLMAQTRAVNIQDQIHFLHLAQGDKYMRAHAGQTYLYDNGAFQLYKGVMPESVISRCRRYAECVEGCLWTMAKRCKSRSEKDLLESVDRTYRAISALEGSGGAPASHPGDRDVGQPIPRRGLKRGRVWIESDAPGYPGTKRPISEEVVIASLRTLTLDNWRARGFKTSAKTWTARARH